MKDIKGYEGLYAADESGKIWSRRQHKFLKAWLIGHGYEMVMLYKDKIPRKFLVHRLIALTFIRNSKTLREVNHKDANRLNNRPENLEWVTSKKNKRHARRAGLYAKLCKLTEEQVIEIRRLYKTREYRQVDIANMFNTTQFNVSWIIRGRGWKDTI